MEIIVGAIVLVVILFFLKSSILNLIKGILHLGWGCISLIILVIIAAAVFAAFQFKLI